MVTHIAMVHLSTMRANPQKSKSASQRFGGRPRARVFANCLLVLTPFLLVAGCGRVGFDSIATTTDTAVADAAMTHDATEPALAPITFIQTSSSAAAPPTTTASTTLPQPVTIGNALIVGIFFINSGPMPVTTITDSAGAPYTILQGPSSFNGFGQYLAFAPITSSGTLTVTVTTSTANQYLDVRVHEYAGISLTQPLDVSAEATGSGVGTIEGPAVTTTGPAELIVSFTTGSLVLAGPGMTTRSNFDADLVQDRDAPTPGPYTAPFQMNPASGWATTIVALRPKRL